MQDKLMAPFILKELFLNNAGSKQTRDQWKNIESYLDFMQIDRKLIGEPLGYGYWNLVFICATDDAQVIKIPSPWSPAFIKKVDQVDKEIDILSRSFGSDTILNPFVDLQLNKRGQEYAVVRQRRVKRPQHINVSMVKEDPEIFTQFMEIVEINRKLARESDRIYDFIGFEGVVKNLISPTVLTQAPLVLSNIMYDKHNRKLYLPDLETLTVWRNQWGKGVVIPTDVTEFTFEKVFNMSAALQNWLIKSNLDIKLYD